ncbi:2TM domain-containing protein [Chryseobacterium populi]|uniref:2TM domain-containing protein n=1 Tax=Chryseobacterium populi TaxID=1144316 RepID=J3CMU4_9FLAO|nr:2TM domain-containing protein [Chryseobacterium populi]EJL74666.1 hypothetical protein PMI13_00908 [Chryseobacterium populi]
MDYNQAYERVAQLKKFYKNLAWFAIIAGILFFNDYFEHGKINFSTFNGSIILVIWGIILTVKAAKLFIFDADWERKILQKELKKTKEPINF